MDELPVLAVDRLDLVLEPHAWTFAAVRRRDIAAYFEAERQRLPQLWNGRVLLMHRHALAGGVLRAALFETDFASFLAWRDWGCPDRSVVNAFAMGALRGSDGAFLLGEMAAGTANAGRVYFPCGTPDPSDVRDGVVDFAGSVAREVAEETGLTPDDYTAGPWAMVPAGPRLALIRVLQAAVPAAVLAERIAAHLAGQARPELAGIRVVRTLADLDEPDFGRPDLDGAVPDFVRAYLRHVLAAEQDGAPPAAAQRRG